MHIKPVALLLAFTLFNFNGASVLAKTEIEKQAKHEAKVKQSILKLGVGKDARIAVRLKDKTQLVGFISEAGESSFVMTDAKAGTSRVLAYSDVAHAKGHNLSTGAKIAIGVGIVVAIILLLILKKYCDNEGGC
jgi:hypothetical protein